MLCSGYIRLHVRKHNEQKEEKQKKKTNKKTAVGRVNSGIFGQTAKFGQPLCLFHMSIIGIKNK